MKSRLLLSTLSLASAATMSLSACNDPNQVDLILEVTADTLKAYTLTGTPPSYPAAFLASQRAVTRADGSFNFDIAFDIDASSQVVVYPQRLVGVPCVIGVPNCAGALGAKPVGLLRLTVAFDSLLRAPASGYVFDSTFVMKPGQGLVMQVQSSNECPFSFSTVMYSKIVIDSINPQQRSVYFRAVNDPNCGYRNLVPGAKPTN